MDGDTMFLGLRTIIYPAADLPAAKAWFTGLLGRGPYFDEPFYVGFDVGGYELGLQPAAAEGGSPVTFWGVEDADAGLKHLLDHGAALHSGVAEVGGGIRVAVVRAVEGHLFGVIENPHFRPQA